MPKQETFLRESAGPVTVEVIKTYDPSYAHEVFRGMEQGAKLSLVKALQINEKYALEEIPDRDEDALDDLLWSELTEDSLEDAREYPKKHSFFVVSVSTNGKSEDRFVSPDWPSAEAYARMQLSGAVE